MESSWCLQKSFSFMERNLNSLVSKFLIFVKNYSLIIFNIIETAVEYQCWVIGHSESVLHVNLFNDKSKRKNKRECPFLLENEAVPDLIRPSTKETIDKHRPLLPLTREF